VVECLGGPGIRLHVLPPKTRRGPLTASPRSRTVRKHAAVQYNTLLTYPDVTQHVWRRPP
jgi:hypothetical protein